MRLVGLRPESMSALLTDNDDVVKPVTRFAIQMPPYGSSLSAPQDM